MTIGRRGRLRAAARRALHGGLATASFWIAAAAFWLALAWPRPGAAQRLDPARLIALPVPGQPAVSPDGRHVAFTVTFADTLLNHNRTFLWLAPVDGRTPPRPLTGDDNVSSPRWSPDSRRLAWLSGGHVRVLDDETAGPRSLAPASGGVRSFRWGAGSRSLVVLRRGSAAALPSADVDPPAPGFDAVVEGPETDPWEFRFQPVDGGLDSLLLRVGPGVGSWDLSPRGDRIVWSSNGTGLDDDENLFDLWMASVGGADRAPRQLTNRFGPDTEPCFSPDGRWLAWQVDQDTTVTFSQEEIAVSPLDGRFRPTLVTLDHDRPLDSIQWRADSRALWFESPDGGDNRLMEVDRGGGGARQLLEAPAYVSEVARSASGGVLAFIGEGLDSWPDLYIRAGRKAPRRVTRFGEARPPGDWPEPQILHWASSDGWPLEALVLQPVISPSPWPAVAVLHGGPFNRVPYRLRSLVTSVALASRGYLVYHPQFRGSRSGTQAFGLALRGDPGGGDLQDVLSGLDSLEAGRLIDTGRIGVYGWSYGGYLAARALSVGRRFGAGVSLYGISDFLFDHAGGRAPSFEREYLGRPWWVDRPLWIDRSPLWHVDDIVAPILLLHGQDDPAVPIIEARALQRALREQGRTVELVAYPREGHGFREPNHRVDAARRVAEWFDRYLR